MQKAYDELEPEVNLGRVGPVLFEATQNGRDDPDADAPPLSNRGISDRKCSFEPTGGHLEVYPTMLVLSLIHI